jgi:Tfp pilus assembly protein PilF
MKRAVFLVFLLMMSTGQAMARTNGTGMVTGLVIAPNAEFNAEFEILLVNESTRIVNRAILHAGGAFTFNGLDSGIYYLDADVPGYKSVHQRVEVAATSRSTSASIVFEPETEVVVLKRPSSVDVTRISQSSAVLKDFDEATKKLQEGNSLEARRRLEGILMEAPGFYDAHRVLGAVYQQERRFDDAEKQYRTALELRPQFAGPLVSLGSLYLEKAATGDEKWIRQSREVLLRSLDLERDSAFAYYLLGVGYYKSSQYPEAQRELSRALELEPKLGNAHLALANVSIRLEDWPAALSQLDSYLRENPQAPNREAVISKRAQIEHMIR